MATSRSIRWFVTAAVVLGAGAPGRAGAAGPASPHAREVAREDVPGAEPGVLAIVPVGDAPAGPSSALGDLVHQLRAACRERSGGVATASELAERLGLAARDPVGELERTYAAAQAAFQADEVETALRLLRGVVEALERSPESAAGHDLWRRAHLRIALAERALGRRDAMAEAIARVLALEPDHLVDEDQYAPSFRRDVEEVRRGAALARRHALSIRAPTAGLVAYVEGKEVGPVPARIRLPPGAYHVAAVLPPRDGVPGPTRTPAVTVEIGDADREVVLDSALAAAVRVAGGPGLAVDRGERAAAAVALGRWARASRVIAVEEAREGGDPALATSMYEVETGALVREARARLSGGTVPPAVIGALASYLVGGSVPAAGPGVARRGTTLILAEPRVVRAPPAPWLRPAAYATGVLALGAAAIAVLQARAAADDYRVAGAMVRADGALQPGLDRARYDRAVGSGDAARRGAYVAGGASVALAVTAAVLGYLSVDARGAPSAGFRF